MPGESSALSKQDLFARLAQGHAAGITVVTPSPGVADELAREFDEEQIDQGRTVWEAADIYSFEVYAEKLYEDAIYSDLAADLPRLLTRAQQRAIWISVVAASNLLSTEETARACSDAWYLAHSWGIAGMLEKFPGNDDTQAFAQWSREYARRCERMGATDHARLPDLIGKFSAKRPKLLVAYGFDPLTPQEHDFLGRCLDSGIEVRSCSPDSSASNPFRTAFDSANEELDAMAKWARARLESGARRIGVVVPELQKRRSEVTRVFSRVMRPDFNIPGASSGPMPFKLSAGRPLTEHPIVDFAVGVLEFSFREVEYARTSHLIRSPFLAGAVTEFAARARLDAKLRERLPPRLTLARLIGVAEPCPILRSVLERLFSASQSKSAGKSSPHLWAQHFTALLDAVEHPRERPLDSEEQQAREQFNDALREFARLGNTIPSIDRGEGFLRLRRLCAEESFQPKAPDVPIQVLDIAKSRGLEFDCLWISGLTEDAWPLAARPNPFLPVALQKKAGIPQAGAEASLEFDRRITAGWLCAAPEVVFSWPQKDADRDLAPSPLLAGVPERAIDLPVFGSYRDSLFRSGKTETIADGKAPPLQSTTIKGGTRVLADQAACPFRAFARHRLGAEDLAAPAEGLDAMQRGQLLHELMAGVWRDLKSSSSLSSDLEQIVKKSAAAAVAALGIEGRFAELERKRLEKLAREWLEVERGRGAFEVVAVEEKRQLKAGDLSFSGRVDRLDRLEDGSHALIDYKTGAQLTPRMWMGERPDEPQLPLYALNAAEDIGAVAFAKLKTGQMRFMGFSRREDAIPGVKPYQDWDSLFSQWKSELETLAEQFASGDARVDPKRGVATCRYCGLQPLCRVYERLNALEESEGDE